MPFNRVINLPYDMPMFAPPPPDLSVWRCPDMLRVSLPCTSSSSSSTTTTIILPLTGHVLSLSLYFLQILCKLEQGCHG